MSASVWEHVSQLHSLTELEPFWWRSDLTPQQWTRLADFKQLQLFSIRTHPADDDSDVPLRTEHFLPWLLRCLQLTFVVLIGSTLSLSTHRAPAAARRFGAQLRGNRIGRATDTRHQDHQAASSLLSRFSRRRRLSTLPAAPAGAHRTRDFRSLPHHRRAGGSAQRRSLRAHAQADFRALHTESTRVNCAHRAFLPARRLSTARSVCPHPTFTLLPVTRPIHPGTSLPYSSPHLHYASSCIRASPLVHVRLFMSALDRCTSSADLGFSNCGSIEPNYPHAAPKHCGHFCSSRLDGQCRISCSHAAQLRADRSSTSEKRVNQQTVSAV